LILTGYYLKSFLKLKWLALNPAIPCHYNVSFFWIKNINPANDQFFKREVERMGIECSIMHYGNEIKV